MMKLTAVVFLLLVSTAAAAAAATTTNDEASSSSLKRRRLVEVDNISHHPRLVVSVVGKLRGSALRQLNGPFSQKQNKPLSSEPVPEISTTH
jgi:hypothetical protein